MKPYRKIAGLALFAFILLSFYFIFISKEWKWSEFFFLLAEASLSICVTLWVIEFAIKKDKEQRSVKSKYLIYYQIVQHIVNITLQAQTFLYLGGDKLKKIYDNNRVINLYVHDLSYNTAELATILEVISNIINNNLKENDFYYDENRKEDDSRKLLFEKLIEFNKNVVPMIDDMRSVLIPRLMEISDDENLRYAALEFEGRYRVLESALNAQKLVPYKPVGLIGLGPFLSAAASIYIVVRREMQIAALPEKKLGVILQEVNQKVLRKFRKDNLTAIALQIASFLICFILSAYALVAMFKH